MPALSGPDAAASRRLGLLAVSVATMVWATGIVIVKWSSLPGLTFAMCRLWAGSLISIVALLVTRRRVSWATFKACGLGGVFFAADIGLGFSAVKLTSIANVAVIGTLSPVVIAVVSALRLKERISRRDAMLVGVSFLGVLVVAVGSSGTPSWSGVGDLLAVLGIGSWTAYWFFSRHARRSAGPIEYFACVMFAAAAVMTPVALLVQGVPHTLAVRDLAAVGAVALFPGFVGHSLVIWSHAHVESWRSSLITQCNPVLTSILAWIALGEPITPIVALGGAVVIGATASVIVRAARRDALPADVADQAT